jgi:hypothetical protein
MKVHHAPQSQNCHEFKPTCKLLILKDFGFMGITPFYALVVLALRIIYSNPFQGTLSFIYSAGVNDSH